MKRAVIKLASGSFFSKILGFLRETLFASWFGTTEVAAAFRIAFAIVNTFINTIVGDTLTSGLVPLYQKLREESEALASALLFLALSVSFFLGFVIGGAVFWGATPLVPLFAPGISDTARFLAVSFLRIMSLCIPLIIIGNTAAFIEAAHGRYKALSSRAALTNIGVIGTGFAAVYFDAPILLAVGYVVVYFFFMLFAFMDLIGFGHLGVAVRSNKKAIKKAGKRLWINTYSLLGLPVAAQLASFVERIIASWMGTSVIPSVDYAKFLSETLVAFSAVPLGIAILSKQEATKWDELRADAVRYGKLLLVTFVPLTVWFYVSAGDIIRLVYMRGAFTEDSAIQTSAVFRGLSVGLGFVITAYFLQKTLNKALLNKSVVLIVFCAAIANVAFDYLFWDSMGPAALGYGNGVFGLVIFSGALTKLKIWKLIAPILAWLAGGAVFAYMPTLLVPDMGSFILNILLNGIVIGIGWFVVFALAPPLRETLLPLLSKAYSYLKKGKKK